MRNWARQPHSMGSGLDLGRGNFRAIRGVAQYDTVLLQWAERQTTPHSIVFENDARVTWKPRRSHLGALKLRSYRRTHHQSVTLNRFGHEHSMRERQAEDQLAVRYRGVTGRPCSPIYRAPSPNIASVWENDGRTRPIGLNAHMRSRRNRRGRWIPPVPGTLYYFFWPRRYT